MFGQTKHIRDLRGKSNTITKSTTTNIKEHKVIKNSINIGFRKQNGHYN